MERKARVKPVKGKGRPVDVDATIVETKEHAIDGEDGGEMNTLELGKIVKLFLVVYFIINYI